MIIYQVAIDLTGNTGIITYDLHVKGFLLQYPVYFLDPLPLRFQEELSRHLSDNCNQDSHRGPDYRMPVFIYNGPSSSL